MFFYADIKRYYFRATDNAFCRVTRNMAYCIQKCAVVSSNNVPEARSLGDLVIQLD